MNRYYTLKAFLFYGLLNLCALGLSYLSISPILWATHHMTLLLRLVIFVIAVVVLAVAWMMGVADTQHYRSGPKVFNSDVYMFAGAQAVSAFFAAAMVYGFLDGKSGLAFLGAATAGTVGVSFLAILGLSGFRMMLYSDQGQQTDDNYRTVWRYGREETVGVATQRQVYERFHGNLSWSNRYDGFLIFLRVVSLLICTFLPSILISVHPEWGIVSPGAATTYTTLVVAALMSSVVHFVFLQRYP